MRFGGRFACRNVDPLSAAGYGGRIPPSRIPNGGVTDELGNPSIVPCLDCTPAESRRYRRCANLSVGRKDETLSAYVLQSPWPDAVGDCRKEPLIVVYFAGILHLTAAFMLPVGERAVTDGPSVRHRPPERPAGARTVHVEEY